ncbi:alpha/beta hydrolase [Mycoplasma mycoides]|uniref:alpha/beta hydrolase n=1 Tax=Mycoplasma mycoides TaxID=2102 RepID=UPI002240C600|nr:alpha/beta fold hydrolase [Mycoplasma mycoides]QVK09219.1 alpha/beta hydrolase [Mycoplasma mycoides subsp. capri]
MILSLYVWLQIRKKLKRKVSYQESLDFEYQIANENGYNFDHLDLSGFNKEYKTINTRFGKLKIFKHGTGDTVIVYCHGILSNNRNAIKFLDYCFSRNITLISYDNFGWGESDKFGKCTLGIKEADLLKDVIDFVKKDLKPKKLVIYGESMGGGTIYSFISKYNNKIADKFIVDAGYNSFLDITIQSGFKKVWYFIYLSYLFLPILFKLSHYPVKRFIKRQDFKNLDNVLHIQSTGDALVDYKHFKKHLKYLKNKHVYSKPIRHCMGIDYLRDEHYSVLDDWIEIKK